MWTSCKDRCFKMVLSLNGWINTPDSTYRLCDISFKTSLTNILVFIWPEYILEQLSAIMDSQKREKSIRNGGLSRTPYCRLTIQVVCTVKNLLFLFAGKVESKRQLLDKFQQSRKTDKALAEWFSRIAHSCPKLLHMVVCQKNAEFQGERIRDHKSLIQIICSCFLQLLFQVFCRLRQVSLNWFTCYLYTLGVIP